MGGAQNVSDLGFFKSEFISKQDYLPTMFFSRFKIQEGLLINVQVYIDVNVGFVNQTIHSEQYTPG